MATIADFFLFVKISKDKNRDFNDPVNIFLYIRLDKTLFLC